ncbi:MAG: L-rhamnose mutarotase [Prevotella sp.]|jgi:L-rhamnose mutarotase|nr:L-rhamnose mutarotase [Prevotella sp.]
MEGYIQHISGGTIKRYVQFLEISDNPALIEQYRKWHSEEYNWQEVRDGIRAVGILEMEIYIFGSKLVMIVDAPADFQWEEAMNMLATLPRQAEWEAFVSQFQGCSADARSDEKWQPMERMFRLY